MQLPSFYTVIPAFVRYNTELTDFDKLMYGEIVALTNANNYCWATNKYFVKVFNKSERTIKYSLARLIKQDLIISTVTPENGNERILTLNTPHAKNGMTPHAKNCPPRARPSTRTNNTSNNTFKYSRNGARPKDTNVQWFNDYLKNLYKGGEEK